MIRSVAKRALMRAYCAGFLPMALTQRIYDLFGLRRH